MGALGAYVWGFARGLFGRIFAKVSERRDRLDVADVMLVQISPGDVMLFTSSGSGKFNLVGQVTETRVVQRVCLLC